METKFCKRCGDEKELSMFAKYRYKGNLLRRNICRECNKPNRQKHYQQHATDIIAKNSEYKKKTKTRRNERERVRRKDDPVFRIRETVRSHIKRALAGKKNGVSINKYVPYTFDQLVEHLIFQFEPWMTIDNQGKYDPKSWDDNNSATWKWQLDHIIPQSDLPFTSMDDENFKKCWALENLRPLSAKQNIKDGPRRTRHKKAG